MTDVQTDADVVVDRRTGEETETSEPEVAHIGRKDDVTRAYITGEPITALCGTVFVPTRDPSNFPVCPACEHVMKGIRAGRFGSN